MVLRRSGTRRTYMNTGYIEHDRLEILCSKQNLSCQIGLLSCGIIGPMRIDMSYYSVSIWSLTRLSLVNRAVELMVANKYGMETSHCTLISAAAIKRIPF